MGLHRRIAGVVGAVGLAVGGCRRAPPSANPPPAASSGYADRLAPGELPPGIERAFDLTLPRGARIEGRFEDSVVANVPSTPEEVANAIGAQAESPEVIVGSERTIFPALHVRNAPSDHHLRVEIAVVQGAPGSRVTVQRVLDLPPAPPESNEEAMKKAGLDPKTGGVLDPNSQQ